MKRETLENGSTGRGRRHPGRDLLLLICASLLCATPSHAVVDEEEDEIGIGSVMASIPDRIAEQKRELAAAGGFSMLGGVSGFMGSDNNVYRSPAALEKKGLEWGDWAILQTEVRTARGDKWISSVSWNQTQRPRYANSNSTYGNASSLYVRRLGGGVRVEANLELSHKNDDATTIVGQDYLRDYAYWRSGAEAALVWRINERHMFTFGGEQIAKNYSETKGLRSIDWTEWALTAEYRRRFGPYRYLEFSYSSGERGYRKELAATQDGRELPDHPTELHRYRTAGVSCTMPVGTKTRFEARYDRSGKTDLFAGYENNRTHTVQILGAFNAMERLEIRTNAEQSWRRYEHIMGDAGKPLAYALWQVGVGSRFRLVDTTWLFLGWNYYARDTNKSSGSFYRDYRGSITTTGMSVFF
jgi:hypothetical protein